MSRQLFSRLVLSLLLPAWLVTAGCSGDPPYGESPRQRPGLTRLKLDDRHGSRFLGFYVASGLGFYAEEGLEVILEETGEASEREAIPVRVVAGEFDFAVGSSALVRAQQAGLPAVVLANIHQLGRNERPGEERSAKAGRAHRAGCSLYAARECVQDRPEFVRRFVRASLRGWRWAVEHPEEAVDEMLASFPQLVDRRGHWQSAFRASLPLIAKPGAAVGELDCASWSELLGGEAADAGGTFCDSSFL